MGEPIKLYMNAPLMDRRGEAHVCTDNFISITSAIARQIVAMGLTFPAAEQPPTDAITWPTPATQTEVFPFRYCTACGAGVPWGHMGPIQYHDCKTPGASWTDEKTATTDRELPPSAYTCTGAYSFANYPIKGWTDKTATPAPTPAVDDEATTDAEEKLAQALLKRIAENTELLYENQSLKDERDTLKAEVERLRKKLDEYQKEITRQSGIIADHLGEAGCVQYLTSTDEAVRAAIARAEAAEALLNPRTWGQEENDAWNRNIPDMHAAFAALRELLRAKHVGGK